MGYKFREYEIPDHMQESLDAYIANGRPVGGFLTAVLENNLSQAMGRADDDNLANLPAYSAFLYNEAPSQCHGSREKVFAWLKHHPVTAAAALALARKN